SRNGNTELQESKKLTPRNALAAMSVPPRSKRMWDPRKSTVEAVPNTLVVSHEQPGIMGRAHWHAQVEVNFVFRGAMEYHMHGHSLELQAGDLCLFWGGLPHQVVDTS